mmetsp:Transcript_2187/g.1427  ORF Transcript_2187/g.1427 Transcript_2187/m.1427 type:complete len:99 (-) Transcript_2187:232-528(-)
MDIGRNHLNSIYFSPLSRFMVIAGFGNLSGDLEVFDILTRKLVGRCNSRSASHCEWHASGRSFLTAVLTPRMRIDNGYNIFKYTGKVLGEYKCKTELY